MIQALLRWFRFNLWYFQKPPWDTGISPPELLAFLQDRRPGRALDLGCGTGTNVITLARAGWQVVGIDFALWAVETARRKCAQAGVDAAVQVGDVSRLENVAGPFDLILDIGCFHSLGEVDRAGYRAGLERLLEPGGVFLIYAHLRETEDSPVGIDESEIARFTSTLTLAWREDSLDSRGRKAVWLKYAR